MSSSKSLAVLVIIVIIVAGVGIYMFWPKFAAAPVPAATAPAQTSDLPAPQNTANEHSLGAQIYTQTAASSSVNPFDTYKNPFQ